ncbi:hypothetical protein Tco_1110311 [Tanacetum coccineum]|uniref:Reverse transcriptase n=1 Tax=Tanacetum coccineum TaxID=301880 RepID=A0ABQ5IKK4_9ASTR
MWTVMMEKEVNIDMEIARNILAVARDLAEGLNRRQAIINEAKVNKNTTMVKSDAFFRVQQDQDLALKKGSSLIMVQWILQCVTFVSFSICVNGERFGYFKGGRGLRKGDPMSSYRFTLVMEIPSLIVQKKVDEKKDVVKEAIKDFGVIFGLLPNYSKSSIIFRSISMEDKQCILDSVPFKVEKLPVKYLGVPLTSKRISVNNCKSLIDKVISRVSNWKKKCLSYVGRLQLIAYVLESIHVYWASVFLLPYGVIKNINKILKRFLWNQR